MAVKQPTLYVFPDVDALAASLRRYVLQAQADALKRHNTFRVAVSGGSLPATLARALLSPPSSSSPSESGDVVQWGKWEIFFADERLVPLDHADSNYRLVKDELLDKIPAAADADADSDADADTPGRPQVHAIDASLLDDAQEVADAYEQELVRAFAAKDSVRLPVFDLMLLGTGPDGHTCSLFPGHALLREADAWVAPIDDAPKPPPRRVTLTLPVVTHAVRLAFVVTGAAKQPALRQAFAADDTRRRQVPCGLVNAAGAERVSWFVDEAAAEGVDYPVKTSY